MKTRKLLTVVFSLFFLTGTSQNKQFNDSLLRTAYEEYFKLPRESLFIHTNKTSYLVGEKIWLKTYIFDRKNGLSSKRSSNVHVDLFDNKGKAIIQSLVLNNNGVGKGQIELDTTLASGIYFLKASTNWMKNFKEDDSFVQRIEVINSKKKNNYKVKEDQYDVQFLPEGGNLLQNTSNVVGVKALDELGQGVKCEGTINNSSGETVATFKTNFLGMGKFLLSPEAEEKYTATIKIGTLKELQKKLPQASKKGVSLRVNNYRKDAVIITLKTNSATLEGSNQNYHVVIHKNGELTSIPVTINKKQVRVALLKKLLFKGVNTITLFTSDNQPVAQRMFFNDFNFKRHNVNAINIQVVGDSTNYDITSRSLAANEILNASISVLPSETKSYNQQNNILSSFYLKPYLSGTVENPGYYFNKFDAKSKYELDLLLLTQGWSRYSWDDIFNNPVVPKFDFENGITFNGKILTSLNVVETLLMHPTEKNNTLFLVHDNRGRFHLKNFYPYVGEEVYFSYYDNRGNMKKPIVSMSPIERNSAKFIPLYKYTEGYSFLADNEETPYIFIEDDYEVLNEIKLKAKVKRDQVLVNARVIDIEEEEIRRYPLITDFIQRNGFDVYFGDGMRNRMGTVFIYSRRASTLGAAANNLSELRGITGQPDGVFGDSGGEGGDESDTGSQGKGQSNFPMPTIFIDGVQISDFSMLLNMPTKSIERVVVDKTGVGLGMNGFGGVIKIFTRKGPLPSRKTNNYNNSFVYKVKYGFLKPEKYYAPRYAFNSKEAFKRFGAISWHNDIILSREKNQTIKIDNTLAKSLDFYIEGFTNTGNFISQKLEIVSEDD